MYRAADIKNNLMGVIGWRQNYDVSDFTIADSLTNSETGLYFQDFHPLLTLQNLKSIAPDFNNITYPTWISTSTYRVGDRVTISDKSYRAKVANVGKTPETSPTEWERFDPFSEWLEEKTKASILKAAQKIWTSFGDSGDSKNIIDSKTLFDGAGRMVDTIQNSSSIVGFELIPLRAPGMSLKIDRIGTQFSGQGTITIYLMHTSRREPIKAIVINQIRIGGIQWTDLTGENEIILPYVSSDNDAGGSWYLVYNQNELPDGVKAINKSKDWSTSPCATCSRSEFSSWKLWSQFLEVHPFKMSNIETAVGDMNDDFNNDFYTAPLQMWDHADQITTYTQNYGLNLQVTVKCDITDILTDQRTSLQNVIGYQLAADMVREMAYNPNFRINRGAQNVGRLELLYELDGDSQSERRSGLVYELGKAFGALKIDTKTLSRVCFPCNNRGIKFRTT